MNIHNIALHLMPCGLHLFWIKSKVYTLCQISFLCDWTGAVFISMTFPANQHKCLSWGRGNMLAEGVVGSSVGGNWGFRANQCVWTEGLQRRAATAAHSQLEHVHPHTHACCQPGALSLPSPSPPFFHADRIKKERIVMEVSSELSEVLAMVREIDRERRLLWQLMKRLLSFPIYSQWRNAYLLHTSPFFHLICMQIEHPMQMGQAGEEGGFQTCCASSFQSVIHGAHGGVHLNPRVNGNPAAVSQFASRCSPRCTVDDRRSCCQSLH